MRVFYLGQPEHGGQSPLRPFDEAPYSRFSTRKERCAVPWCRFRMWQHVQRVQCLSRKFHPNHATILDGTLLEMFALDVVLSESDHVTDSRSGIPQQQDHGTRPQPLITGTTDEVARR